MFTEFSAIPWQDVAILTFLALKYLFIIVAGIFVLSGIDEFFIDICYMGRELYRSIFITPKHSRLTEEQLLAKPEQAIAMMIPCWDESAVIRRMLENTLKSVNYTNYVIFVGTYPNDPATQREVDIVREKYGNVERIVTPKDGPTSKADCLNWLYQGIQLYEEDHGKKFDIFLMDDSEDIIHPLMLKLCNIAVPKLDMIQLPVHPIPRKWTDFTGNHYLDEFAENHTRDLIVREMLTGAVPSAGVGTAFSRKALLTVYEAQQHQLFNINSLTEDYDFGLKIKEFGLRQAFVRQWVWREKMVKGPFSRKPKLKRVREYISIREFFPNTFSTAVRQKTRWVMGIALQGWTTVGWRGGLASCYMLLRDRKSLVTNFANLIGNALFVCILAMGIYNFLTPSYKLPPLVDNTFWMNTLISICLFFLMWRMIMRVVFVVRTYDWKQGGLAIPRLFWANIINFVATNRAVYLYFKSVLTGQKASWDKTAHVYPSEEELRAYRRKLGDLLLDRRFLTLEQLDAALAAKKNTDKKLGQVLLEMGTITEEQLIQVLGVQFQIESQAIDPYDTPHELLEMLPFHVALRYRVYPIAFEKGQLVLATNDMLDQPTHQELENETGVSIALRLAAKSDISFAIKRGYTEKASSNGKSFFGQKLVDHKLISHEELLAALKQQRKRYRSLRAILIAQGAMTRAAADSSILDYYNQQSEMPLSNFWIDNKWVSEAELNKAKKIQRDSCPPLGEILVEMGALTAAQLQQFLNSPESS